MPTENTELTVIIEKTGIEPTKANELLGNLPQIQAEREVLVEQYNEVLKLDINNISTSKKAGELRKLIKDNRTKGILVWHKTTKEYFLTGGKFVDAVKNKEEAINERMEETLEEIEKYFEIQESKRKESLRNERSIELSGYTENPSIYPLGEMVEKDYQELKEGLKLQKQAKVEAERKAQFEKEENERLDILLGKRRIEIAPYIQFFTQESDLRLMPENEYQILIQSLHKAKADYDLEQENIRKENERQKKELEEKEAQLKAEREESERKAKAEKEKQDAILAEQQRQNDLKLKAERDAKEKLEKEIQDKKDAELKAENERKAAEKKALNAPEKDKLKAFAKAILEIKLPDFTTDEAKSIALDVFEKQKGFAYWVINQSEKL
jgi:colicin import membrane protein